MASVIPPLSYWGKTFLQNLRLNDPTRYAALNAAGNLGETAAAIESEAQQKFNETVQTLENQDGPPPDDPVKKDSWMRTITNAAREVAYKVCEVTRPGDPQS